jgi:hypothetical protein
VDVPDVSRLQTHTLSKRTASANNDDGDMRHIK